MNCTDECTALSVQTQQAFNNKGYAWPFPLALTGICGEASAMSRKLCSSVHALKALDRSAMMTTTLFTNVPLDAHLNCFLSASSPP